jgi:pimeloyl-ACP methyl ester carboxylesterase
MNSKRLILVTFPFILLAGFYFLGPAPEEPAYDKTMMRVPEISALEDYVSANEAKHKLKPDNEARIVWADSGKQKTPYAVVYLHGFSASPKEGDPVHARFARKFGCNLYLARISDHGIDTTEQLLFFTADRAWQSAKEALAIGKQLGEKVIVMSTSTGGTLALMLAAYYPDDVYELINMSPNIAINNPLAFLLNNPWGLQIARIVKSGNYNDPKQPIEKIPFWNDKYRLESTVQLQQLLEDQMMPETFHRITQPSLTLYYYKNEEEQDQEVMVSAMLEMHKQLATPDSLKEIFAIPNAGAHVLASPLASKDVEGVYALIEKFAIEKLEMSVQ